MRGIRRLQWVWRLPRRCLILLARVYQAVLSPYIGRHCRFLPTCSNYFIEAVEKRGAVVGTLKGLWRICRCNPLCRGGYDPVDPADREDAAGGGEEAGRVSPPGPSA